MSRWTPSPMTDDRDWRFFIVCPHCQTEAVIPLQVAEQHEYLEQISVRCEACAHEWTISIDNPPLIVRRKPDRRQSH